MSRLPDILIREAPGVGAPRDESSQGWIVAPWLAGLPVPGRDLLALLPVLDVNTSGFAKLRGVPASSTVNAIAAIFCADPFLRVRDAVQVLRAAGISRVTNFPTIQIIDGSAAYGYESAGVGTRREAEVLGEFARAGFDVTGFATTAENGTILAREGVRGLVLHPGPASLDWRVRAAAGRVLGQALRSLRHLTDLPARVMCPDGYGPELDTALALADGCVRYDDDYSSNPSRRILL